MKSLPIIIFFSFFHSNILFAQVDKPEVFTGCATDELMNNDKALIQLQKALDAGAYQYFLEKSKTDQRAGQRTSSIEYIPVVVHIIHNGGPENISNAQVQAAINNINAKYLPNNGYQIQFCLAQRDPQGNATTGITRDVSVLTTETMELDDVTLKNINRWNPTCYLNIWVVKEILSISMGSGVIGYGFFPSAYGTNIDGVVIESTSFGVNAATDAIGAHEIGHYLGLYHTFENGCVNNNCLQDGDQVCDTPPDQTTFASCNPSSNSCSTDANDPSSNNPFTTDVPDLSDDYMDYSAITCYNQFTPGQYDRMQYFLTTVRNSMLGCLSCTPPCPTPVIASIILPTAISNVTIGTTINFSGTATNSNSYQWYINPNNIFSTNTNTTYTFNTPGSYWIKFLAISSNSTSCGNGIDSILVIVAQPVVSSCIGSLQLLNTDDGVLLPQTNQIYSSNGFTWECWIKLTTPFSAYSSTGFRPIITAIDPVVYEDMCLSFGWSGGIGNVPGNHLAFKVDGPNSSTGPCNVSCDYYPPGGFVLGTWYHVAATMDYSTQTSKLYLNGALVDTKNVNSTPFTRIIGGQLGWYNPLNPGVINPPLGGNMDEVRIWSRVRTPTEIATYYNQCLAGNEQGLLLYYRCNQSAGSTALDATVNGNNGNLSGTASWSTQQPTLVGTNCSIGCTPVCPSIKTNNDTTICAGKSLQLNSTITGFTSYTWTPATGLSNNNISNPIATPVITTTYVVSGTSVDANQQACISTDTVIVKVVNRISPTLNLGNDITLCASAIHTFYATPGFSSYHWSNGGVNETNTVYGVGKYWVTVIDSCGNIQSDTVLVTLAPSPILHIRNDTTICSGDSLTLNFTPAVFNSYQWTPSSGLNCITCANPIAKPLTTTKYYLVASTADGCTAMDSITLTIVSSPILTLTNYTVCDGQLLTINPVITGGTPNFVYNWNNNNYNGISYTTTPTADSSYSVFITDANGCVTPTFTGSITVLPPLKATVNAAEICLGDTAKLIANASGGTGNYTYTWMPVSSSHNTLTTAPQINTLYTVTISDGCTIKNAMDTASVLVAPPLVINPPPNILGCRPVCINLTNLLYDSLSNWNWNFGDGSAVLVNKKPNYCYDKPGTYNITLTYTTNLGCIKTVNWNNIVTVFPYPTAAFTASTFETDIFNTDIDFYNESVGYTSDQWSFGDLSNSTLQNPSHVYAAMGNYPVMLIVQNQKGCVDTVIHEVQIKDVFTFYAPNTFTPNEDNFNETFLPVGTGWDNTRFKMSIYDRWGNLILTTTNPNQGWDGKMKGMIAQQDIYVWKVELQDIYAKTHSYSGTIAIIK